MSEQESIAKNDPQTEQEQQHPITAHIEKALAHKQKGNEFVAQKEWKKASFEYKHIPLYLSQYIQKQQQQDGSGGAGDDNNAMVSMFAPNKVKKPRNQEEYEFIVSTLYAAYCNLSLAHLNLGRISQALQAAQSAVAMNPENPKGYYRRARARLASGMAEEAGEDFNRVLRVNPGDSASLEGLQQVQVALSKAKEKEQKMFKKMFA